MSRRRRFRLPVPPPPSPGPAAFMVCPVQNLPPCPPGQENAVRALYEWAFAQAQAVVRPSILERDLLGVWN